jgi:hypothetical protein
MSTSYVTRTIATINANEPLLSEVSFVYLFVKSVFPDVSDNLVNQLYDTMTDMRDNGCVRIEVQYTMKKSDTDNTHPNNITQTQIWDNLKSSDITPYEVELHGYKKNGKSAISIATIVSK